KWTTPCYWRPSFSSASSYVSSALPVAGIIIAKSSLKFAISINVRPCFYMDSIVIRQIIHDRFISEPLFFRPWLCSIIVMWIVVAGIIVMIDIFFIFLTPLRIIIRVVIFGTGFITSTILTWVVG